MRIYKNVKIPAKNHRGERPTKYPFAKMKIGDSLKAKNKKEFISIRGAANNFARTNSARFVSRQEGFRVWRIK